MPQYTTFLINPSHSNPSWKLIPLSPACHSCLVDANPTDFSRRCCGQIRHDRHPCLSLSRPYITFLVDAERERERKREPHLPCPACCACLADLACSSAQVLPAGRIRNAIIDKANMIHNRRATVCGPAFDSLGSR